MMMRVMLSVPAMMALALGSAASAQDGEAAPPASVTATIAALEAGDAQEAARYITSIEWLLRRDRLVSTPREAIALLSGCEATATSSRSMGKMSFHVFEWACADETYTGQLIPNEDPRTLVIADLMTKSDGEAVKRLPSAPPRLMIPPPAPPSRPTPEQVAEREARMQAIRARGQRNANTFGQLVMDGDLDGLAAVTSDIARVRYSFHDPFLSQSFVEYDGEGGNAMREQVAHALASLGPPTAYECKVERYSTTCKWEYEELGTTMFAFISPGYGETPDVTSADFRYATREKLLEAAERAQD